LKPAELVDWNPDPLDPRNVWGNACVHAVAAAYGIRDRMEWRSRPAYAQKARRLADLYGRGIAITDLGKIARGEIPWPQ
jgi:hypothetical protein